MPNELQVLVRICVFCICTGDAGTLWCLTVSRQVFAESWAGAVVSLWFRPGFFVPFIRGRFSNPAGRFIFLPGPMGGELRLGRPLLWEGCESLPLSWARGFEKVSRWSVEPMGWFGFSCFIFCVARGYCSGMKARELGQRQRWTTALHSPTVWLGPVFVLGCIGAIFLVVSLCSYNSVSTVCVFWFFGQIFHNIWRGRLSGHFKTSFTTFWDRNIAK